MTKESTVDKFLFPLRKGINYLKILHNLFLIKSSGLFDKDFYLRNNLDILEFGIDPALHYLRYGGFEGRDPGPNFCSGWYINTYQDVKMAAINPLIHYLKKGRKEGREAQPLLKKYEWDISLIRSSDLFNEFWYSANNPDVAEEGIDPALHYLLYGGFEGRDPVPHFHSNWYLDAYEDVKKAKINPLVHYLRLGREEDREKGFEEGREFKIFKLDRMYDYSKQQGCLVFEDLPERIYLQRPKVIGSFSGELAEGEALCPPAYVSIIEDAVVFGGSSLVVTPDKKILSDELKDFSGKEIGIKSPLVKFRHEDTVMLEYKNESNLHIEEGILLSCDHDNNYFHWLVECLPKLLLVDSLQQFKDVPLLIPASLHNNLMTALERLNINNRQLIAIESGSACRVERLICPSALSRIVDRYESPPVFDVDIVLSRKWLTKVGECLKSNVKHDKKPWRKIFLARRKGLRALGNREDIELMLLKQGFEVVELEGASLDFQIELFSQAAVVVAPTGATLTNMLFCRPGTKVIIFMSNHEVTNYYFWSNLGAVNNLDVAIIAGERLFSLTNYYSVHDDYMIDPDIVLDEIKIRIVFLVQYMFMFNSYHPLFLAFKNSSKVKPYICIIPNVDARMPDMDISGTKAALKELFGIQDCLIDYDGTVLKDLSPDAVFVQTPYDNQRPEGFAARNLSRFTNVCYIPYGVGLADCPEYHYGLDFYNYCWKIFLEAPISLKMCHDYLGEKKYLGIKDKIVVSGSPKIEMTMNYEYNESAAKSLWRLPRSASVKRIIWAPHWTFEWKISGDGKVRNGYSQFMRYYRFFLETARNNQNIDIVMRAHPLMYTEVIKRGLMPAEELENFRQEFSTLPNTRIEDAVADNASYLDLFFSSDAMITDGISFLTEYPVTGKPLLHTIGTDNPAKLNAYGDRLARAFYRAFCEEDIVQFINKVVFKGEDEMLEQRNQIINIELYIPEVGVSTTIRDDIVNSLN